MSVNFNSSERTTGASQVSQLAQTGAASEKVMGAAMKVSHILDDQQLSALPRGTVVITQAQIKNVSTAAGQVLSRFKGKNPSADDKQGIKQLQKLGERAEIILNKKTFTAQDLQELKSISQELNNLKLDSNERPPAFVGPVRNFKLILCDIQRQIEGRLPVPLPSKAEASNSPKQPMSKIDEADKLLRSYLKSSYELEPEVKSKLEEVGRAFDEIKSGKSPDINNLNQLKSFFNSIRGSDDFDKKFIYTMTQRIIKPAVEELQQKSSNNQNQQAIDGAKKLFQPYEGKNLSIQAHSQALSNLLKKSPTEIKGELNAQLASLRGLKPTNKEDHAAILNHVQVLRVLQNKLQVTPSPIQSNAVNRAPSSENPALEEAKKLFKPYQGQNLSIQAHSDALSNILENPPKNMKKALNDQLTSLRTLRKPINRNDFEAIQNQIYVVRGLQNKLQQTAPSSPSTQSNPLDRAIQGIKAFIPQSSLGIQKDLNQMIGILNDIKNGGSGDISKLKELRGNFEKVQTREASFLVKEILTPIIQGLEFQTRKVAAETLPSPNSNGINRDIAQPILQNSPQSVTESPRQVTRM